MRHYTLDHLFSLRGDLLLNVFLKPSEHEWLENQMQSFQLVLIKLTLVHGMLLDIFGEPFLELFVVVEELGHNEMKQSPKLSHRILDRGS
jgi:hypothetical protein